MNIRTRRMLGVATAAALSLGLAACGTTDAGSGGGNGGGNADSDTPKEGPYAIATVPKVEGITWFEAMANGVEEFNEDLGDEVDAWQIGPDTEDAAKQVQIIEDLIAQDVDVIEDFTNVPPAVYTALTQAIDRVLLVNHTQVHAL